MTLGQLLLVALIVAVIWVGGKLKKHEERIGELEGKRRQEEGEGEGVQEA